MKTSVLFFPFDLFGSRGTALGTELLADAFRELLDDNRREKMPTRARAYRNQVRMHELAFETTEDYSSWRQHGRETIRDVLARKEAFFWIAGNHLGVLPVYEELVGTQTLVVQIDAHLDVYNLSDCTAELSHGNFLLHCDGKLPSIINVGARELLLRPEHVGKYYSAVIPAAELHVDAEPALAKLRSACQTAERIVLDIDCDGLDPAHFPAVSQALPFGLTPALLLRVIDAVWSEKLVGVCLSEFLPAKDTEDRCLTFLMWLLEYLLLKRYER